MFIGRGTALAPSCSLRRSRVAGEQLPRWQRRLGSSILRGEAQGTQPCTLLEGSGSRRHRGAQLLLRAATLPLLLSFITQGPVPVF